MFVRSASHEIRTPLNTVFLGLKLLQGELQGHESEFGALMREWLNMIQELLGSTDVAVHILNDLLAYEKLEAGILQLDSCPFRIVEMLEAVINAFTLQVDAGQASGLYGSGLVAP